MVYGDRHVTFTLSVETSLLRVVEARVAELTNGTAKVTEAGAISVDVPVLATIDLDDR